MTKPWYNVQCICCGDVWRVSLETDPKLYAECEERAKTYLDALPLNGADDGCSCCQYQQEKWDRMNAQLAADEAFFDSLEKRDASTKTSNPEGS